MERCVFRPSRNNILESRLFKGRRCQAIYILEAYQGQGVGTNLVKTLAEKLSQSGLKSMLVWVLADNPACQHEFGVRSY